ncbi:hypothetical protein D3C78_1716840 [compost metagenome]
MPVAAYSQVQKALWRILLVVLISTKIKWVVSVTNLITTLKLALVPTFMPKATRASTPR